MANNKKSVRLSELLRVRGPVDAATLDTNTAPGYPGDGKDDADKHRLALEPVLEDLQERLYAQGKSNPETAPRVLVVVQGLDTSGKGGVIRHAIGMIDPQGFQLTAFKAPTREELEHHYLWRIEKALPAPGMIGIFDRSHYEDVLVVRVENLVPREVWEQRYDEINAWEKSLHDQGYTFVKCFLILSKDEQKGRLLERVENPEKYYKHNPGDLDTRAKWDQYMAAFSAMLSRCSTDHAPWYVIPADKKWYKDWAVAELLREKLADLDLQWPAAEFDVEAELKRVRNS